MHSLGHEHCLTDFRIQYAKEEWDRERIAWRAVIQLNLIRSILTILDTLDAEIDDDELDIDVDLRPSSPTPYKFVPDASSDSSLGPRNPFVTQTINITDSHHLLKLRLGPLRGVEQDLRGLLGAGTSEVTDPAESARLSPSLVWSRSKAGDFHIPFRLWQEIIKGRKNFVKRPARSRTHSNAGLNSTTPSPVSDSDDSSTDIIVGCRDDMIALWKDETIQLILKKRRVVLEDAGG